VRPTITRLVASALTGVCVFAGTFHPYLAVLGWVAWVPLLWALRGVTPRRAMLYGFAAGWVTHIGGFYWITGLLVRFAHMPRPVGILLCLLLSAYQGLAFVGFAWSYVRIRNAWPLPIALIAPIAMTVFDFAVPQIFPCYVSITQTYFLPIIQIADITGPVGVTFLMVLVSGAIWDWLERRSWKPAVAAVIVVGLCLGYGFLRIRQIDARRAAAPQRRIGMVQANVGIHQKGRAADRKRQHELHLDLSRDLERQGVDLIVWPESSYPYYFDRGATTDWPMNHPFRVMRDLHTPVLFGTITFDRRGRPYNSTMLVRPDGTLDGPYDKNYLLLFGEYVPFYDELNIRKWIPESSNFQRGYGVRLFEVGDMSIGPMICYEDIIPAFARKIAQLRPNIFINMTNDAWFGATTEPWEHLWLAVYRSVEHRLDMVRSVNTGVTSHIDATGRLVAHTRSVDPVLEPGVKPVTLIADVALLESRTVYGTVGDVFGYLNIAALIGLLWQARRRTRSATNPG
jgi:apolipoprotein N-acyltransferase